MKRLALICSLVSTIGVAAFATPAAAQNPLIRDQFTADPTARVFEGKIYVYPSHDILATPGKGRQNWFCMEDYHVFSSENLVDWKDHGVIVNQTQVPWADPAGYAMWAPDCVYKNGKYYFYFPAAAKEKGFRIGVATADKPYGPFTPEAKAIDGVRGIDPVVLVDKDGSSYIYYSQGKIFVAKLRSNMVELDSEPQVIANLPTKGLIEGPFVFERNGIYYLTYPHVENKTERLEYATSKSPMGPFAPAGVIMDESASGCWTNHHSIVEYQGQWYLFYHDKDLSPEFDKNRSVRADKLFFNEDGSIQKVTPTLRGVGIVPATSPIQIDRYSATSQAGVTVSFLNDASKKDGWKVTLDGKGAWVRFDAVDFATGTAKQVNARVLSSAGALLEIRLDSADGPLLSTVKVGTQTDWTVVKGTIKKAPAGLHNLVVSLAGPGHVDLDWVSFE
jgi:hypothetical protein